MISFILGMSFIFEAAALALAEPFIIKRAIFNGLSPEIIVYVGVFSIVFFVLAQICFFFTRRKYEIDSIFQHPYLNIFEKEEPPIREGMIEGREIAEIHRGEIVYANAPEALDEEMSDAEETDDNDKPEEENTLE